MKPRLAVTFFLLLILSACATQQAQSQGPNAGPIVIEGDTAVPQDVSAVPSVVSEPLSTLVITLEDKGRTIDMKVGESFLLNLGSDFYDWTAVEVDNQSVLSREKNVAVINGAQGIYQALSAGTATLTASGDPQCINLTPPCLAPSVIFTVTVVVK